MPWRILAGCVIVMMAAILLWSRHSRAVHTVDAKSIVAAATTAGATAAIPAKAASSTPPVTEAAATVSASSHPSASGSQPSQTLQPAAATRKLAPEAPASTDTVPVKVVVKNDVTIRSFGTTAAKPGEKTAAAFSLTVRANENSWISVTSDGQLVSQETLIAPANTSFHATRELVVRVGNAGGVSFLWKGEEIPSQGGEAEAKTFVFDAQGMRVLPGTQTPAQN